MDKNHKSEDVDNRKSVSFRIPVEKIAALSDTIPDPWKIGGVFECWVDRWLSLTPAERIRELTSPTESTEDLIRRIQREEIAAHEQQYHHSQPRGRAGKNRPK